MTVESWRQVESWQRGSQCSSGCVGHFLPLAVWHHAVQRAVNALCSLSAAVAYHLAGPWQLQVITKACPTALKWINNGFIACCNFR